MAAKTTLLLWLLFSLTTAFGFNSTLTDGPNGKHLDGPGQRRNRVRGPCRSRAESDRRSLLLDAGQPQ